MKMESLFVYPKIFLPIVLFFVVTASAQLSQYVPNVPAIAKDLLKPIPTPTCCDQGALYCTSQSNCTYPFVEISQAIQANESLFQILYNDVALYPLRPAGTFPQIVRGESLCDYTIDYPLITWAFTFPQGWLPIVQIQPYFQFFRLEFCNSYACSPSCTSSACSTTTTCRTFHTRLRALAWDGQRIISTRLLVPDCCKCVQNVPLPQTLPGPSCEPWNYNCNTPQLPSCDPWDPYCNSAAYVTQSPSFRSQDPRSFLASNNISSYTSYGSLSQSQAKATPVFLVNTPIAVENRYVSPQTAVTLEDASYGVPQAASDSIASISYGTPPATVALNTSYGSFIAFALPGIELLPSLLPSVPLKPLAPPCIPWPMCARPLRPFCDPYPFCAIPGNPPCNPRDPLCLPAIPPCEPWPWCAQPSDPRCNPQLDPFCNPPVPPCAPWPYCKFIFNKPLLDATVLATKCPCDVWLWGKWCGNKRFACLHPQHKWAVAAQLGPRALRETLEKDFAVPNFVSVGPHS